MSNTKKLVSWIVGIVVVILIVVLSVKSSDSNNTIKIGGVFSLTGNAAAYGEPARDAMSLAVEEINKQGGVNGRKLEVVFEDSQFDAKIALSGYQSLSARGIRYILTNGSPTSLAVRGPIVKNNDLQFEVAAVSPLFTDQEPNTCRLTLTADVSGKSMGDFISNTLRAKSFAALTLNDDYGKAMTENTSKVLSAKGVVIKGAESFDKNATDFRTQITKLLATKADALLVVPAAGQAEAIFKQLKELGWKGSIISDNFTIINTNLKDLSVVEGVYFVNYEWSGQSSVNDSDQVKTFKSAYYSKYGVNPPIIAANTYDSVKLLVKGLTESGLSEPKALSMWLVKNIKNYSGVTGSISLNDDCEALRSAVIQQVKNKEFVTVK